MNQIYNDNCFNVFNQINHKMNLILVDLPYGQTDEKWDVKINLNDMWKELYKISYPNTIYIFFCTTKFGYEIINSNPSYFRYDLVWEKYNSVGFLNCNQQPLRSHEMIYIFYNTNSMDDVKIERNLKLRDYAEKTFNYINKPYLQIQKDMKNGCASRFMARFKTSQFSLCTEKTYNKLIELYKINEMEGFKSFEELKKIQEKDDPIKKTYNIQKTEGKPYKTVKNKSCSLYTKEKVIDDKKEFIINTGTRCPISVLKYNYDKEKLHSTQKPVPLLEFLIKSYSNEGDNVLDFTMGSGSTIIACINTKRNYIGIEMDKTIFEVAKNRIEKRLI